MNSSYNHTVIKRTRLFLLITILLCFVLSTKLFSQHINTDELSGLKPRSIGPAGMSGRVTSIDVVLSKPDIIYIGTASGGLWKSTSGGTDWKPIFDDQPVASIGAVAVNQNIPDIIWVGTGEGNPRNSQTSGDGIYKSIDGGRTWIHLGLDNTRNINRLILDPNNQKVAYVAALGSAWGESKDRGVFKTTDGGKTWEKILYVDEKTGASDLVMDPVNPNKLIATMWQYRRWPWFFKSGGPGSGLYVTLDGGKTWNKRTEKDGLPKGESGRIGIAVSKSSPNVVYALIESKKTGLYRSDDGGYKFHEVTNKGVADRPFYYSDIYVDPKNENRIYYVHSTVSISEDGGKTFTTLLPYSRVHPDHHAWWINPNDPDFMIDGNDGGLAITRDKGKTWRFIENLPLAQFYHISVDNQTPYNVFGGMQDNGSWKGPSRILSSDGILNSYWEMLTFGDGFNVIPDLDNPRYCYSMSQGGNLYHVDMETGHIKFIQPVSNDSIKLRFNWNAAIANDPINPSTIYFASQFLYKTTDHGKSWQTISPDLTTNNPEYQKQLESGGLTYDVTEAENYTTIVSIAPSSVKDDVIWVGTDDGNVQVTTNGGTSWNNVVNNIVGVPPGTWVPEIRASNYNPAEAFVVFDNHRRDDWTPYVFFTDDYGKTWKSLINKDKYVWGYALSIVQDPVKPNLIFLGTEFGLYFSINKGKSWTKWSSKTFPTVSTMSLQIQKNEGDLVIGTFGRAVYILDDLSPLRELANKGPDLLTKNLAAFSVKDAVEEIYKNHPGVLYTTENYFKGKNRPYGAMISFIVNSDTTLKKKNKMENDSSSDNYSWDSIKVDIISTLNNKVIRTLKDSVSQGINRIYWALDKKAARFPNHEKPKPGAPEKGGKIAVPGKYKIKITYGPFTDSTFVNVKFDPRMKGITHEDFIANDNAYEKFQQLVEVSTDAADQLRDSKNTIHIISERIKDRNDESAKELKKINKNLNKSIDSILYKIIPEKVQGIKENPALILSKLYDVDSRITTSFKAPDITTMQSLKNLESDLNKILKEVNMFFSTKWNAYKTKVSEADVSFFKEVKNLKVN